MNGTPRSRSLSLSLAAASFLVPLVLSLSAPLRPQGGDTVPAKIGMHVLQCERSFDLAGAEWVRDQVLSGQRPYYVVVSDDQRRLVSTWGPAPALLGAVTTPPLTPGTLVDDATLARRARVSASLALALSSLFLFLAIAFRVAPLIAFVGAMTASLSFAGVGLLGQALWQQTVACLVFTASWAALSRGPGGKGWAAVLGTILAVGAALIRPADAIVALGGAAIGIRSLWNVRNPVAIGAACVGALAMLVVFGTWNQAQFGTLLPVGQSITHTLEGSLFTFHLDDIGFAWSALLLSPSRGLLFFAPIVIVAIVVGARASFEGRAIAASLLLQLAVYAAFHKWWGGVAFGPRLCVVLVWASSYLLFGLCAFPAASRRLATAAAITTVAVGLIGIYGYDPRKWDLRVDVDADPRVVWSPTDSVIAASLRSLPVDTPSIVDSPPGPFSYCVERTLSSPRP